MFPAVKSFFIPVQFANNFDKFFESELAADLWNLYSIMSMLHTNFQEIERERV
jgi:hypothetical protein